MSAIRNTAVSNWSRTGKELRISIRISVTFFDDSRTGSRFDGYGYQSFRTFLQDVSDVRSGQVAASQLQPHRPSFHSSLVSTAIVEANNVSLAQGGNWVNVDLESNELGKTGA